MDSELKRHIQIIAEAYITEDENMQLPETNEIVETEQLSEGMYSVQPKPKASPQVYVSDPNTPDDVFIRESVDRPGKIGICLKGRTAYIPPEEAVVLASQLRDLAEDILEEAKTDELLDA